MNKPNCCCKFSVRVCVCVRVYITIRFVLPGRRPVTSWPSSSSSSCPSASVRPCAPCRWWQALRTGGLSRKPPYDLPLAVFSPSPAKYSSESVFLVLVLDLGLGWPRVRGFRSSASSSSPLSLRSFLPFIQTRQLRQKTVHFQNCHGGPCSSRRARARPTHGDRSIDRSTCCPPQTHSPCFLFCPGLPLLLCGGRPRVRTQKTRSDSRAKLLILETSPRSVRSIVQATGRPRTHARTHTQREQSLLTEGTGTNLNPNKPDTREEKGG